jgi:glycosyltransferase involved in cell wall biosynthesis
MKNIHALIKAKIPKGIHLYFVGNEKGGELFNDMKKFADENENVTYYGEAFGQDKIDLLCSADAVIVPSINEPFGIVGLEGLASKSIVLSSWVDGLSDFLNKDNSIYCGTTPESIENAYHRLLNLTSEEKDVLIKKGLETCEEYSWEKSAKLYKQVISDTSQ